MGADLDMERIANELGAERRGKVSAGGGYFGALQLAAEVATQLRVPEGGERPTEPWSEAPDFTQGDTIPARSRVSSKQVKRSEDHDRHHDE